jgi:hypothetical protein
MAEEAVAIVLMLLLVLVAVLPPSLCSSCW